jgi:hypothetical protein
VSELVATTKPSCRSIAPVLSFHEIAEIKVPILFLCGLLPCLATAA